MDHAGRRNPDGYLCCFSKSGRTWVRYMLTRYLAEVYELDVGHALDSIYRVVPAEKPAGDPTAATKGEAAFAYEERADVPKLLCSRALFGERPFGRVPTLLLLRNLLDLLVSWYFHRAHRKRELVGTLADFVRDSARTTPLIVYLDSWASANGEERIEVTTYEALVRDPAGGLSDMLGLFGVRRDTAAVERAVANASFERMSGEEERVSPALPREARRVRKGVPGGYRTYLSPADVEHVRRVCASRLSPAAQRLVEEQGLLA